MNYICKKSSYVLISNMDNKQKILDLYKDSDLKQFSKLIKKDNELYHYVLKETSQFDDLNLSQRIWLVLNPLVSPVCEISVKPKRWISIKDGFRFCGKASECICAKQSVSENVKKSKSEYSELKRKEITDKRIKTNIEKYGVSNSGQTDYAKSKHKEFYSDTEKNLNNTDKIKQTNLDRYNVDNPMKVEEFKKKSADTIYQKYGVYNINQLESMKEQISKKSKEVWKKRKESNFDYNNLKNKFENACQVEFLTKPFDYKGTVGNHQYDFRCLVCKSEFKTYIYCGHLPICKICNPTIYTYKSNEENEILDFLKSNDINLEQKNKSIINPYELDLVDKTRKIAIEYNGLYWHSELSNNKLSMYHLNKLQLCQKNGYRLISIFSDEWNNKKDIVKEKLLSIFNKSVLDKVHARKCNIEYISNIVANDFYNKTHLQGSIPSSLINIGLYHNTELVSCMSLSKPRSFIKSANKLGYELTRYSSSKHVRGGAGKLLNEFESKFRPNLVYSYADARWSVGNLYLNLGFKLENKNLSPGYWYVDKYSTRIHRFNFTKSKLVKLGYSSSLTEWEIMQTLKYDRIWDCGQYKFIKNYI